MGRGVFYGGTHDKQFDHLSFTYSVKKLSSWLPIFHEDY